MTGTSLTRPLTFQKFHEFTPGLEGASRAAIFFALPERLQDDAWCDLGQRTEARAAQLWEDACRDEELAALEQIGEDVHPYFHDYRSAHPADGRMPPED